MAFVALAATVASAAISAYGAVKQGQAASSAANYAAQVSANNALIANQNADYAIAAGQQKAATTSLAGASRVARVKATQAASGIDVSSGSALGVQEGAREAQKLDSETVLSNAELTAYGYRTQQTGYVAQSQLDTATAQQATTGADLRAGGGLLGAASGIGFKWGGGVLPPGAGDPASGATEASTTGAP